MMRWPQSVQKPHPPVSGGARCAMATAGSPRRAAHKADVTDCLPHGQQRAAEMGRDPVTGQVTGSNPANTSFTPVVT